MSGTELNPRNCTWEVNLGEGLNTLLVVIGHSMNKYYGGDISVSYY